MSFKRRLKSFITEIKESATGAKSPEDENLPAQLAVSPAVAKFKEHLSQMPTDPTIDQDILSTIEKEYYEDGRFDAGKHELDKLSDEDLALEKIDGNRKRLRRQLSAVSRKVSELVLENHPAYASELTRVMELQENLESAAIVCHNGRGYLADAKMNFTTASLGLLANYRKRQQLIALLKSLRTIKTLQRTDIRLREMLEEEDYPGAIQLCLECQKAASTFKHYKCISELSSKLQDTLEMIEESLDVALSKTCSGFDEKHYEKVQTAYRLLGKTQTAMDQLHMHFTSAIHNTAFTIVLGYVALCTGAEGNAAYQKSQYTELCGNITPEVFTPCLVDLCKALWEVMKSYYKTIQWHEKFELQSPGNGEESSTNSNEATLNRRYIRQKLEHGLGRIWGDIQQKVRLYIISTDLSQFKYDEFIQVLDVVNRLIMIGADFCGSKSEILQDSLRKQSVNYMRNYHRCSLEELHMFLENEVWELCPVKASFSILLLQEFKFLRHQLSAQKTALGPEGTPDPQEGPPASVGPGGRDQRGYFERFAESGSPFEIQAEEEEAEDVLETNGVSEDTGLHRTFSADSDSDEDIPDELKQDFVDEQTGEMPIKRSAPQRRRSSKTSGKKAPIITNTTLNVCRLFGKYMQMMTVLTPISFEVIFSLSQLFDYYLYAVYSFFATDPDMQEINERSLSIKLRTTLKRIHDNLIVSETALTAPPEERLGKVPQPHLSPVVRLDDSGNLYGLAERVVATESLVFLAEQLEFLQRHLELMIPPAKKAFLQQFYSQTVCTTSELRKPVYRTVAARSVNYDQLYGLMSAVKWDQKEIMSQHSTYVDVVLQELETFKSGLTPVHRRVPVPKPVTDVLWEHCIRLANRTFVEGYSSGKKCTNEGRALMQLDFQQFLMKLEKLTDLRPIPDRDFVETYIKAYYLPEAQLENWIRDHKEYSVKQLVGLVTCLSHLNKKSRQKLVLMIEEMDRSRRM